MALAFLGDKVQGKDGQEIDIASLSDNEVLGIYFSAHWCPPCRGFTPQLAECYTKLKGAGKKFEVVFVSSDRDQESFDEYYKSMPWLAVPFVDRDKKSELSQKYAVSGIPTLVLVDPKTGETITKDGRGLVTSDLNGEKFPWK